MQLQCNGSLVNVKLTSGNVHVGVCSADHANGAEEGRAVMLQAANYQRVPQRVKPAQAQQLPVTDVIRRPPCPGFRSTSKAAQTQQWAC